MPAAAHVEYVGFTSRDSAREYTLRVKQAAGDSQDFKLLIPNEAFLSHRVRYQDGPEICFLKLQRELMASPGELPASLSVTDADLEEYRAAHNAKPQSRRPKAPTAT
jgi:hypothetical protein